MPYSFDGTSTSVVPGLQARVVHSAEMKAIVRHRYGPPESLSYGEVETPVPSDDEAAIAEALRRLVTGGLRAPDPQWRDAYSYPAAAERMAEAAQQAISARTGPSSGA